MKKGIALYFCFVLLLLSSSALYANQNSIKSEKQYSNSLHNVKANFDKINSKISFYDTQILNIHSKLLKELNQSNKNLKSIGINISKDNVPEAAQILKSQQRISKYYDSQLKIIQYS
ncbi:MAG TPA: hypothetical protein QF753_15345 [Victivallales bacterium]|nr:hypothetical protein [Victivallales bacterium]